MADALRRLVNISSYGALQSTLESWYRDYHVNSCDQNLNRCCGHYAGVDTLKTRLLPWLGTCFSMARPSLCTDDTGLQLKQDSALKEKQIRELSFSHDNNMQKMETQLCSTRLQLDSVQSELAEVQLELDDTKDQSATTLLATEDEILQLKADLRAALEQLEVYKRKVEVVDEYERQVRLLREEVSYLTSEKSLLQDRLGRSLSSSPLPRRSRPSSPSRSETSPTRAQLTRSSRHARLLSRFSDLYAVERLEAQSLLRRYVQDLAMVQKIIFIAAMESFQTAKLAYRKFKLRVRKSLSSSHVGPGTLEDAAVDYIVHNLDLYDVQASVDDVISTMNVNPRISFPPEVDFTLVSGLIRETCRLAFAMQTLEPPLDLAFTSEGELYSDNKYRRSYDSELAAPLVLYHVWPALTEGDSVLVKGEAVTRRGALWRSRSRSSSPVRSRSLSPSRVLTFSSTRSESPGRLSASWL
ncbi:hypothetical protein NHX12_033864 [Muraenolepis orangiensis]|uniref:Mitochondria-eating protein n=1 Tax=Muraenolepis orangiensis TaxID=630683 RepID=A0A9Q0E3G5_9TELE|nr:hypothetical protein NHX12_033864 [Muraenolepis orangiensis]